MEICTSSLHALHLFKAVSAGWAGWAMAHPTLRPGGFFVVFFCVFFFRDTQAS